MTAQRGNQNFMKNITQKVWNHKIKCVYYSMREINEHLKHVMKIKKTKEERRKNAKMIMITWSAIGITAVVIWTIVYNLIF